MRRPSRPLASRRPKRGQINAEQLAALSHEFRTPLNGVLGLARLLEGTPLTAEQRSYAVAMRESGEHLLGLVNDFLDFAKLGAGKVELNPSVVDVEDMLRSVCELLSPRADEKGLEVAWAAPADLPKVRADEIRLKQILLNFAGNAVKFTKTGGVLASVAATADGGLRFSVEDTGPGVQPGDHERIFAAFAQAQGHGPESNGAGLGLAIARQLAHAMDGEVGVEDTAAGGARFWFEARFENVPKRAISVLPLSGRTIGVATASPIVGEAARHQILASGGTPIIASDVATLMAQTEAGDVLLLDHTLAPSGEMLAAPADRSAIVLLAPSERERLDACLDAGFAGYLIKPLRRASLAERVLVAAGARRRAGKAREDERIAPEAAPGARVLLVEDNPVNALLARALLSREGCQVDHANCGEEALAAVQVGDYDIVLMDMRMPGWSGEETARRLREIGVIAPIVALTANAFEDDRRACEAAGMNDVLVKPLSPETLRAALSRWVGETWTQVPARAKVG